MRELGAKVVPSFSALRLRSRAQLRHEPATQVADCPSDADLTRYYPWRSFPLRTE